MCSSWYAELWYFRKNVFRRLLFRVTLPWRHCRYPWPFMISFFEPVRKRFFSYFAVSEGRSEHVAISIHGHNWLYYHSIEEGSHKRRGLFEAEWRIIGSYGRDYGTNNDFDQIFTETSPHISIILFRFFRIFCCFSNCYRDKSMLDSQNIVHVTDWYIIYLKLYFLF